MPRPNIPEQLTQAYVDDPLVHACFMLGAQRGYDERETLILLVLELVKAKKTAIEAYGEHLQVCPGHWVPAL